MARRASHAQRRFTVDRPSPTPPGDEVAARLLEDWRSAPAPVPAPRQATTAVIPAPPQAEGADALEYRVDLLPALRGSAPQAAAALQAELGARAAEGWRLLAVVPSLTHDQFGVFERSAPTAGSEPAAPARPARPRRSRKRAAGAREWEAARAQFATERAELMAERQSRPSWRYHLPPVPAVDLRHRGGAVAAVAAAAAVVVVLAFAGAASDDPPAPAPAPDEPRRAAAPVPPPAPSEPEQKPVLACRDVPAGAEARAAVTCATSTKVLTIAGPGVSVELAGVKNRVLGVRREPGQIVVRVGLRNRSSAALDMMDLPGRASLVVGGLRLGPPAGISSSIVEPGRAAEADLRFAATTAANRALGRSGGRADLGIASTRAGQDRRAGVLRLTVPGSS